MTGLSPDSVLLIACEHFGLDHGDARLIRAHANAVYLLPGESAVVRVGRVEQNGARARASLEITRWLAAHGVPVTEPLRNESVDVDGAVVTVWRYYPQGDRGEPPMRALGAILARLHGLPAPPFSLPQYPPLAGFLATLDDPEYRQALDPGDLAWLADRAHDLLDRYRTLDSRLGVGLIHGDPYAGNTLWDGDSRVVLGDWDDVSIGPREQDLVVACHDVRFGASEQDLEEFFAAYGRVSLSEFRTWDSVKILFAMRDLHTLFGYIRRAAGGDVAAARELAHRLRTLRDPTAEPALWTSL
ncbi:phosphotransferase enzyme family protein [Nocardia blacklockiae]|uniref:phosphotransferase enzyme family protein n=1 Tax=Nocardia blacklockiae TaxID=480036 RepID=UPI0018942BA2|nr:aminoglycoside phosphotransferase family protein [Nocardia blacklockiae]MBF6171076.1 aminoglycoside phosphotransferase family protein [Nocardia blacklockiae]